MEAVQFTRKTKRLELVNIPKPRITNPNDILIKVLFSGICRTDVGIVNEEIRCNRDEPFIMGHEICGMVSDIGEDVKIIKKKDKVVVDPFSGCGVCLSCRKGTPHLCNEGCMQNTIGVYRNGGWAEYFVVPQTQVYKLPEKITLEQGVLAEPISYVAHGWDQVAPISVGKKIMVLGAGLTGLLWIIMLHYHGHKKVTICEPNLARHEFIQQLDIKFECISPKIASERQQFNPDFSFDLIIDCSGSEQAIEQGFQLLNSGGKLCLAGRSPADIHISISPYDLQKREKKIVGLNIGSFSFPKAVTVLEFIGDRYISFDHLGIKTYPLERYKEAVDHVKKGSVLKAVFRMPDDCKCDRIPEQ